MSINSLLPYNATDLEKAIEQSTKFDINPDLLRGFKFRELSGLRLCLIWEYSLAQVNIDNLQDKISEGLLFHRCAGTPYAVKLALSWYDLTDIVIEEENPGEHFSEFQIGFKEIPDSFSIYTVIDVAEQAKPLRSRLTRMYNAGYDIRRFILDSSEWGDLLSDNSGVYIYKGSPKLSFGRHYFSNATFIDYFGYYSQKSTKYILGENDDRFRLSYSLLDYQFNNAYHLNHFYQLKTVVNWDYIGDKLTNDIIRPATFSRAMLILSDSKLEDLNSCYSGNYTQLEEETFELSFSFLSEKPALYNNILVDKRLFTNHKGDFQYDYPVITSDMLYEATSVYLGILNSHIDVNCINVYSLQGQYYGNNTWHEHQHFDVPWNEQNFYTKMNN